MSGGIEDSWQCATCRWRLTAPLADRERSLRAIEEHEQPGLEGGQRHVVVKVSVRAKRRYARRVL